MSEVTGVACGVVFRIAADATPAADFAERSTPRAADFAEAAMDHDASARLSRRFHRERAAGRVSSFAEFMSRYCA